MIKEMILIAKRNGYYPPFFLLSNYTIDIRKFKRFILANFVFEELPKDAVYLVTYDNIPKEYEWAKFNTCDHGFRFAGECEKCHEIEKQRKIKHKQELEHIQLLFERMDQGGFKSLREMLNHDYK